MARLARDSRLETREARARLKAQGSPYYWCQIHPGLFVGYRRGARGGVWYVRRWMGNKYRKARLGVADDHADGAEVLSYAQAFRAAIAAAEAPVEVAPKDYTVAEAMADYLDWARVHTRTAWRIESTIHTHIMPNFGARRVAALTATEITRWHSRLAGAARRRRGRLERFDPDDPQAVRSRKASANRILTTLKAALNHAFSRRRVGSDDAWRRVRPFRKVEAPRVRYLTHAECKRLINACEPDFRALVQGALLTGARYGELTGAHVGDYDPDGATLSVLGKDQTWRHIPLTEEGVALMERLTAGRHAGERLFSRADGGPWGRSHQYRRMREACQAAGIEPRVSFHILRHTYGSLLALADVPLKIISLAMGHADTRITERHYAHLQPDHVARTVRAKLPRFGIDQGNIVKIDRP
jgi:integrase